MSDKAFAIAMANTIPKGPKGDKGDTGGTDTVNGKSGTVVLDAGDLEFDSSETYTSGSVGAAVSDLKSEIGDLTGNTIVGMTMGKYRSYQSVLTEQSDNDYACVFIECSEGDVFNIKGYGGTNARLWIFASSNGTIIAMSAAQYHTTEFTRIVAPANTAYLACNFNMYQGTRGYPPTLVKGEIAANLAASTKATLDNDFVESIAWDLNTTRDNPTPFIQAAYNDWASAFVQCEEGDIFYITGSGGNNSLLWMFLDKNGTVIKASATGVNASIPLKITAPANTAYLACNSRTNQASYPYTLKRVVYNFETYDRVIFTADNMIQGGYTSGTYQSYPTSSFTRIRYAEPIKVLPGDVLTFNAGSNVKNYLIGYFDAKGQLIQETNWNSPVSADLDIAGCDHIVVLFRKDGNNGNILPSAYDADCRIVSRKETADKIVYDSEAYTKMPVNVKAQEARLAQMCRYSKGSLDARRPQFLLITDSHSDTASFDNAVSYAGAYKQYFDAIVHCGDYIGNYIPVDGSTSEPGWFSDIIKNSEVPVYMVIGNHEKGGQGAAVYSTPTDEMLYNYFVKPIVDKGWLEEGEYTEGKCYYYHDFTTNKTRLIIVDMYESPLTKYNPTYWEPVAYNSSYPAITNNTNYSMGDHVNVPGITAYSFEAAQSFNSGYLHEGRQPSYKMGRPTPCVSADSAQWFLDTLASTPQDYGVVVAVHHPFSLHVELATSKFCQIDSAYSAEGDFCNQDFYADAVNAFINGSNYSATLTFNRDVDSFSVSKDFSAKASGVKFYSFIGGHWHEDLIFKHETYNLWEVAPVDANTIYAPQSAHNDICRSVDNGEAKDCLTAVAFGDGVLGLTKLGIDMTSNGTYRDFEVLNISGD